MSDALRHLVDDVAGRVADRLARADAPAGDVPPGLVGAYTLCTLEMVARVRGEPVEVLARPDHAAAAEWVAGFVAAGVVEATRLPVGCTTAGASS